MRVQKVEFWHLGKSLALENRSKAKAVIGIVISRGQTAEKLKDFVLHKRLPASAIQRKAEELAVALCGPKGPVEEMVVRDIHEMLCRMTACR